MEYYRQANHRSCIAQCDSALKTLPGDSMLWTFKGSALIELGDYVPAQQANETALKLDPKNYWAAFNLALALTMQRSNRAAPAWREFIAKAGKDPEQQDLVNRAKNHLAGLESAR